MGREHVIADVELEPVAPASPNPWLGSEMEHHVAFVDERPEVSCREIDGHKLERWPCLRMGQVGKLVCATVVVVEAVHAEDLYPVAQKRLREVRSNKAGAARNECSSNGECYAQRDHRPKRGLRRRRAGRFVPFPVASAPGVGLARGALAPLESAGGLARVVAVVRRDASDWVATEDLYGTGIGREGSSPFASPDLGSAAYR